MIDSADLDIDREEKLEKEFSQEKQLIIREDRLEAIAEDIVNVKYPFLQTMIL